MATEHSNYFIVIGSNSNGKFVSSTMNSKEECQEWIKNAIEIDKKSNSHWYYYIAQLLK